MDAIDRSLVKIDRYNELIAKLYEKNLILKRFGYSDRNLSISVIDKGFYELGPGLWIRVHDVHEAFNNRFLCARVDKDYVWEDLETDNWYFLSKASFYSYLVTSIEHISIDEFFEQLPEQTKLIFVFYADAFSG